MHWIFSQTVNILNQGKPVEAYSDNCPQQAIAAGALSINKMSTIVCSCIIHIKAVINNEPGKILKSTFFFAARGFKPPDSVISFCPVNVCWIQQEQGPRTKGILLRTWETRQTRWGAQWQDCVCGRLRPFRMDGWWMDGSPSSIRACLHHL